MGVFPADFMQQHIPAALQYGRQRRSGALCGRGRARGGRRVVPGYDDFMAVALGCSVGCSVVISQLFGGRLYREMKTAVSTSFIAILTLSVVLTVLALIFCSPLMVLLNTPQNIFPTARFICVFIFWGFCSCFIQYLHRRVHGFGRLENPVIPADCLFGRQHPARFALCRRVPNGRRRRCLGDVPGAGRGLRSGVPCPF